MARRETPIPSIHELGDDLIHIPAYRRCVAIASPFLWCACYFLLAARGSWLLAIGCLAALSFVTYGSVSHDLVHRNLGLSRRVNDRLLVAMELIALRSGTAYRLSHLHHHRRYPSDDDVEGAAARMTLAGALREGVRFQCKLFAWAWSNHPRSRRQLGMEGIVISLACLLSVVSLPLSPIPIVYVVLMTMGAWIIPLITSYFPHDPNGKDELHQTRAFRGKILSILAFQHLYHLEHHLYPAVPHHNWSKLARRLDPTLKSMSVRPTVLWY